MQQQQFQQQPPMFMNPQQPMYPRPAVFADPETKLHISKIHDSVTEEILWTQFKEFGKISSIKVLRDRDTLRSRRVAKLVFATKESARDARRERNMTYLVPQEMAKNSKRILVSQDKDQDALKQLQKHNLFINGLPNIQEGPNVLYKFFTQFGEIHSLQITYKKDGVTLAGHGCILFENEKDADKLLKGETKYLESKLTISKYQNERSSACPNFYIKDFLKESLTAEELQNESETQEKLKQIVSKVMSQYGEIGSIIVNVCQKERKPFAFVSFKDSDAEAKVQEAIDSGVLNKQFSGDQVYIRLTTKKSAKVNKQNDKFLHIKNVKSFEDEEELKQFEQKCIEILEKYGKVTRLVLTKGTKPKEGLENSCFTIAEFEKETDGQKFLYGYLSDPNVNQMFLKENPHGNVTICMSKSDRQKMIRSTQNFKQNQKNFQQQAMYEQQQKNHVQYIGRQNFNNQVRGQKPHNSNYNNRGPNQQQRGGQGFNQQQQGGRFPSAGNRPAQNQQQRYNSQQPQQQQQRPQGQAPRPISQDQQPTQSVTSVGGKEITNISLEDLKNHLDEFTKLESAKQSQVLGNLIYPKVKDSVIAQNEPEAIAAKVTGMLIDFTVFEITDILDILESQTELTERVIEALDLIKQQAQ